MNANRLWLMSLSVAALLSLVGTAAAQMSFSQLKPASNIGGYTGNEMSNIYRNSIGNSYTVAQVIQNTTNQTSSQAPYVGQEIRSGARFDVPTSFGPTSKPFSGYTSPSTVSPWMNMFREDLSGQGDLNYQTLVRPMLNQQKINQQVERQNMELGRRLQAVSAQNAYNPQGSKDIYPTGHPTVFMSYSHFYPSAGRGK